MMGTAAEKSTNYSCQKSILGSLPDLDPVFVNNTLPPVIYCPELLVLRIFSVLYPFLDGSDDRTWCEIRFQYERVMEADSALIETIALGSDYYWDQRTLCVIDVLLRLN